VNDIDSFQHILNKAYKVLKVNYAVSSGTQSPLNATSFQLEVYRLSDRLQVHIFDIEAERYTAIIARDLAIAELDETTKLVYPSSVLPLNTDIEILTEDESYEALIFSSSDLLIYAMNLFLG